MSKNTQDEAKSPEMAQMFRQSIAPYSKKLVALHPHLYGSLYRRASEIQALNKILIHLQAAAEDAKQHKYTQLPPILAAIKDAIQGHPPLSWWNLFTATVGYAFGSSDDEAKNSEETQCLKAISEILTEIIRHYQSPNTKLLLEIRLTALDVDARLVELDKIPTNVQEFNETLGYLTSEFQLLTQELNQVISMPKESWSQNNKTFLHYTTKANRLMEIAENVRATDSGTFMQFVKQGDPEKLKNGLNNFLHQFTLEDNSDATDFWQMEQLNTLFDLFTHFPDLLVALPPKELYTLMRQADRLFTADPKLDKVRPGIFFSENLKNYVIYFAEQNAKRFKDLCVQTKNAKSNAGIRKDLVPPYKDYFVAENDLHHICSLIHFKEKKPLASKCDPAQIQKDILNRLISLTNLSQPNDLDNLLKSFSEEEKEGRYFLIQEIILEQFIRWRKLGIY